MSRATAGLLAVWLCGCASDKSPVDTAAPAETPSTEDAAASACEPDTGAAWPSWSTVGEPFFTTACSSCHGADAPNRFGAPESAVFDTEDDVARAIVSIRRAVLEQATMPPGGGVTTAEAQELGHYLACLEARRGL